MTHHGLSQIIDHFHHCARHPNGTFGRLLKRNPVTKPKDEAKARDLLFKLAASMSGHQKSSHVPAGFTFLGQFIDHDITLDVVSRLGMPGAKPGNIPNLRTPRLELDNVYGSGPEASNFLYKDEGAAKYLLTGNRKSKHDLTRNSQCTALIGDFRNDENLFVSQLQLQFLKFHNYVMSEVAGGKIKKGRHDGEDDFEFARRIVIWHYQWIVRHEFLEHIVAPAVLKKVRQWLAKGDLPGPFKKARYQPLIPVEFSVAAYRYGHAQVNSRYRVNKKYPDLPIFESGNRPNAGFSFIPEDYAIDWRHFFEIKGSKPQYAARIAPHMAAELASLPFVNKDDTDPEKIRRRSLPYRNILRDRLTFELVEGRDAARAFGAKALDRNHAVKDAGLGKIPLWYYVLQEADEKFDGRLGDVGGTIVATVLLRLLIEDRESHWHEPKWKPFLGSKAGDFKMADLILCAQQDKDKGYAPGSC